MDTLRRASFLPVVVWSLGLALPIAAICGCDRQPKRQAAPPPPPSTAPARPTTQELLSGPTKTLILPDMPLSIKVPESWKIDIQEPMPFLVGPTPSGKATISLSHSGNNLFRTDQVQILIDKQKKEAADSPATVKRFAVLEKSGYKIVERLAYLPQTTAPKVDANDSAVLDATGQPVLVTVTPVRWTFTVFVPGEKTWGRYELSFFDFTAEQHAQDKDMLDKVMSTLTYIGAAPASQPPVPQNAPAPK